MNDPIERMIAEKNVANRTAAEGCDEAYSDNSDQVESALTSVNTSPEYVTPGSPSKPG